MLLKEEVVMLITKFTYIADSFIGVSKIQTSTKR